MNPWRAALVVSLLVPSLLVAAPAHAQKERVEDAAGDAANKGLDMTAVRVANRDRKIVTRVRFVEAVRGDLIVSIDRRRDWGLRLVSEYRPNGNTKNYVLPGAFTDGGEDVPDEVNCPGFRVRWNEETDVARLRMPAKCLDEGNYGAVRFVALTERGSDTDIAPDQGSSPWIPRG